MAPQLVGIQAPGHDYWIDFSSNLKTSAKLTLTKLKTAMEHQQALIALNN